VIAHLGLGSNSGDRAALIQSALVHLATQYAIQVRKVSRLYETEPWGYAEQPRFLNAAAEVETSLSPIELLRACKQTETALGRTPTFHWGPRLIDVDVLLCEDTVLQTDECTIPHPHMHLRRFVLEPLAEIAPDARHPVLGKTIRELLASIL